jgi:hypothetical protein
MNDYRVSRAQAARRLEALEEQLDPPPPPAPAGTMILERRGGIEKVWFCPTGSRPGDARAVLVALLGPGQSLKDL